MAIQAEVDRQQRGRVESARLFLPSLRRAEERKQSMRFWQCRKRNRMSAGVDDDNARRIHPSDEDRVARKNESRRLAPTLIASQPLQPFEVPGGRTGRQQRRW